MDRTRKVFFTILLLGVLLVSGMWIYTTLEERAFVVVQEVPVEVTRIVEVPVEVTRIVEAPVQEVVQTGNDKDEDSVSEILRWCVLILLGALSYFGLRYLMDS